MMNASLVPTWRWIVAILAVIIVTALVMRVPHYQVKTSRNSPAASERKPMPSEIKVKPSSSTFATNTFSQNKASIKPKAEPAPSVTSSFQSRAAQEEKVREVELSFLSLADKTNKIPPRAIPVPSPQNHSSHYIPKPTTIEPASRQLAASRSNPQIPQSFSPHHTAPAADYVRQAFPHEISGVTVPRWGDYQVWADGPIRIGLRSGQPVILPTGRPLNFKDLHPRQEILFRPAVSRPVKVYLRKIPSTPPRHTTLVSGSGYDPSRNY